MAVSGLLLLGFLVAHLTGNMLILVSKETFNHYGHTLISNPMIYLAEAGLLGLFVMHFTTGLYLTRKNRAARPQAYERNERAGYASRKTLASTTMIFSGLVVLVFVPLHIWGFKFGAYYESAEPGVRDLHRLVIETFQQPAWVIWYVAVMTIVGFHLWHGFGSGFESLGLSYRKGLRRFGQFLAVVIAGGFLLIPVLIYMIGDKL